MQRVLRRRRNAMHARSKRRKPVRRAHMPRTRAGAQQSAFQRRPPQRASPLRGRHTRSFSAKTQNGAFTRAIHKRERAGSKMEMMAVCGSAPWRYADVRAERDGYIWLTAYKDALPRRETRDVRFARKCL